MTDTDQQREELREEQMAQVMSTGVPAPVTNTPNPTAEAVLLEELAAHLATEHDFASNMVPGYAWPEHPDDTGRREDGYVRLIPSDVQAERRDDARRIISFLKQRAALATPPAPQSAPFEMDWPEYHYEGMGCGLEDRDIRDRYEAMRYGWDKAIDACAERLPDSLFEHPPAPQPDALDARTVEVCAQVCADRHAGLEHIREYAEAQWCAAAIRALATAPQHKDAAGVDARNTYGNDPEWEDGEEEDTAPHTAPEGCPCHDEGDCSSVETCRAVAGLPPGPAAAQGDAEPTDPLTGKPGCSWCLTLTGQRDPNRYCAKCPARNPAAHLPASDDARDAGRWRTHIVHLMRAGWSAAKLSGLVNTVDDAIARQAAGDAL